MADCLDLGTELTGARGAEGDIVNCPSRLDKKGKEGLSGITCPVACQSRVAPRPKSGLQAQCGGGLENPWVGTERCVPLNASADRQHLALERRRDYRCHPTLSARYRTGIEQRLRSAASPTSALVARIPQKNQALRVFSVTIQISSINKPRCTN